MIVTSDNEQQPYEIIDILECLEVSCNDKGEAHHSLINAARLAGANVIVRTTYTETDDQWVASGVAVLADMPGHYDPISAVNYKSLPEGTIVRLYGTDGEIVDVRLGGPETTVDLAHGAPVTVLRSPWDFGDAGKAHLQATTTGTFVDMIMPGAFISLALDAIHTYGLVVDRMELRTKRLPGPPATSPISLAALLAQMRGIRGWRQRNRQTTSSGS